MGEWGLATQSCDNAAEIGGQFLRGAIGATQRACAELFDDRGERRWDGRVDVRERDEGPKPPIDALHRPTTFSVGMSTVREEDVETYSERAQIV